MNPKYEFTGEQKEVVSSDGTTHIVRRIRCLIYIRRHGVKPGDLGGWIENEDNLYQNATDAWVAGEAIVFDKAKVISDALVCGNAQVYHYATVCGSAIVTDDAKVFGVTYEVSGSQYASINCSTINGDAIVSDRAKIYGSIKVHGFTRVFGDAELSGYAEISGFARVFDHAKVSDSAKIYENAEVYGHASIKGYCRVHGSARVYGNAEIRDAANVDGGTVCDNVILTDKCHVTNNAALREGVIMAGQSVVESGLVAGSVTMLHSAAIKIAGDVIGNTRLILGAVIDGWGTVDGDNLVIRDNIYVEGEFPKN